MNWLLALAFGLFCALHVPVRAEECGGESSTQGDMNDCFGRRFAKTEAELNKKYKRIMACLGQSSDEAKPLIEAQRAWLKFRDAECRFQSAGSDESSVQPMVVSICMESLSGERIKDFDKYLTCEEGDLSCPVPHCGSNDGKAKPEP